MDFRGSSLPAELDRRLLTRPRFPRFHETRRCSRTGRTARSRTLSSIPPLARGLLWILCVLTPCLFPANMGLSGEFLRFREEFNTLDQWRPVHFRGIERHTRYTIETFGEHTHLKAESHPSASGLIWNETYSVFQYLDFDGDGKSITYTKEATREPRQGTTTHSGSTCCSNMIQAG